MLLYSFCCFLLLKIKLQYVPIDFDVAFLRIKQQYIHHAHYKIAFYVHVFSAVFSLLAGFTQFSRVIRIKYVRLHRVVGFVYITSILFLAAPSGLMIGFYANGGLGSQIAFCLLAVLWFYFTLKAFLALKKREYTSHQIFMTRSFALTLSAITLRFWKYILVFIFQPRPMDIYQVVAWLGWVLNLFIAEIIILKYIKK